MKNCWTPIFVLPNISLQATIGCEITALAPTNDDRIIALKNAYPTFGDFLNRFSDNFGLKVKPTTLILNADAPPAFRSIEALASFRDLIALSVITYNRVQKILYPHMHRILFGESFAIYPWMIDQNYENVIGSTPAILGMHELSRFKGQSSPAVFHRSLVKYDIDQPLLDALMARWLQHYETEDPEWKDVALMRSLNMAYHASLLPAGTEITFYDVGRLISLWVSAFEILVHPGGGDGRANLKKVVDMIENTSWEFAESRERTHKIGVKNKKPREVTLASWLYEQLNACRNDFLHGNPVEHTSLVLTTPQRTIFEYAAPLYRIALTAFLPLTYGVPMPSSDDAEAFSAYIGNRMDFTAPQRNAERALLTANQSSSQ